MNFEDYKNNLNYPRKADFTTTFYYKGGKCIAAVRPGEQKPQIASDAVKDTVVNEDAYRTAISEYGKHDARLREMFCVDLLQDYGLPDNEFTRQLISIAYAEGHSSGYSEIYNCFDALSNLNDLAKKVYGK